eukprot:TRINITY_DN60177_c0_g1_i1.p1 TRINITY_DN60177_c0_g1~~TRINITY_DN60177_c0_g1_i1.p1  ORF type:complete len:214 (+),score=9.44 TRINITY_DN60177_c0_g1_i1:517-1158(+)
MKPVMTESHFSEFATFTVPCNPALAKRDLLGDAKPVYLVLALVDDLYRGGIPQCRWRVVYLGHEDRLQDIFCAQVLADRDARLASGPGINAFEHASNLMAALLSNVEPCSVDALSNMGIHRMGFDLAMCELVGAPLQEYLVCPETSTGFPAIRVIPIDEMADIEALANTALQMQQFLGSRLRRHIRLCLPRVLPCESFTSLIPDTQKGRLHGH